MMLMKNVLLSYSFQNKSKSDEMLIISLGSFGSLNNYNMVIDMKKALRYNKYIPIYLIMSGDICTMYSLNEI